MAVVYQPDGCTLNVIEGADTHGSPGTSEARRAEPTVVAVAWVEAITFKVARMRLVHARKIQQLRINMLLVGRGII
jgi:hypothetical protein